MDRELMHHQFLLMQLLLHKIAWGVISYHRDQITLGSKGSDMDGFRTNKISIRKFFDHHHRRFGTHADRFAGSVLVHDRVTQHDEPCFGPGLHGGNQLGSAQVLAAAGGIELLTPSLAQIRLGAIEQVCSA